MNEEALKNPLCIAVTTPLTRYGEEINQVISNYLVRAIMDGAVCRCQKVEVSGRYCFQD